MNSIWPKLLDFIIEHAQADLLVGKRSRDAGLWAITAKYNDLTWTCENTSEESALEMLVWLRAQLLKDKGY